MSESGGREGPRHGRTRAVAVATPPRSELRLRARTDRTRGARGSRTSSGRCDGVGGAGGASLDPSGPISPSGAGEAESSSPRDRAALASSLRPARPRAVGGVIAPRASRARGPPKGAVGRL
ncbi:hypothetical protein ACHAWF_011096 [Thalassiosira exigua]